MTLTYALIRSCRSPRGSYTKATIMALGGSWPLEHGWIDLLIGSEIAEYQLKAAKAWGKIVAPLPIKPRKPLSKKHASGWTKMGTREFTKKI